MTLIYHKKKYGSGCESNALQLDRYNLKTNFSEFTV